MVDGRSERERLRAETTRLLNVLRTTTIPQETFELLEILSARLDRIELGSFDEHERPTEPERRASSGGMPAVREGLAARVAAELAKGKPDT